MTAPPEVLELAVNGHGTTLAPLRGIRHAGTGAEVLALPDHAELLLRRDPANTADPNAIEVRRPEDGMRLGYVAREIARVLAPLLDIEAVTANGKLVRRPDPLDPRSVLLVDGHDAVTIEVEVVEAGDGYTEDLAR